MTRGFRWLLSVAALAGLGFPVVWILLSSLRPEQDLFAGGVVPQRLLVDHYVAVLTNPRFLSAVGSSLTVATVTTVVCVVVGTPAAYALGRMRFAGRAGVLLSFLVVGLFPPVALVSPLFSIMSRLELLDSRLALVLPYLAFALPLSIWLLVGFVRSLPRQLEEAAWLDGAGRWATLVHVIAPLALPGVAATAILTFTFCWNELLLASALALEPERHTLPVFLSLLRGRYQVPWGQVLAASVVGTLPIVVVVLSLQRHIESAIGSTE